MGQEAEDFEFGSPEDRGDFVDDNQKEEKDELPKGEEESDEEQGKKAEDVKDDDEKSDEKAGSEQEDEGDKGEETSKGVKDEDTRGIRIPKFRFDAVAARAKAAEERAAELEAKLKELEGKPKTAPETKSEEEGEARDDLDAKLADIDVKIAEAMKEGDADAIKELMAESRKLERDFYLKKMEEEATTKATQTAEQLQEAARLDLILTQLEEQFPIFDENSDQFDQDANDKVLEVQQAYIAAGRSPSDALVEAVNLVLPTLGYSEVSDPTERRNEEEQPKRSQKDVKRNTDTAKKQPPDLESVGDDSDKAGAKDTLPDPLQLTDEEYDALPEQTKKALRGDFV